MIAQMDEAMAKLIADIGLEEANKKRAAFRQAVEDELAKRSAHAYLFKRLTKRPIAERLHPVLEYTYLDVPALDPSGIVVMPQLEPGEGPEPFPLAQEADPIEDPLASKC